MKKEVSCGFVLYKKNPELQFLLLKLPRHGEWDFPKGHQNDSETCYATAQRELLEEAQLNSSTDITVSQQDNKAKEFSYEYKSPTGSFRKIVLFAAQCKKNPIISKEHSGFVWVPIEEAKKLLKYPEVCQCLEQIHHFIKTDSKDAQISE